MSFFITLFCFVLRKCIAAAITTTSSLFNSILIRKILLDLTNSVIRCVASDTPDTQNDSDNSNSINLVYVLPA